MFANSYTVNNAEISRKEALTLIYRHTHRDFKLSVYGVKTVLVLRGTTCLVGLEDLTDVEIMNKLPYCLKLEEKRKLTGK